MAPMTAPGPYSQPSPPLSPADEKTWSVIVHVAGIFFGWVGPLVGYLLLRDRGPFIRHHTAAALDFQLTLVIAYVIGIATAGHAGVGVVVIFATWAASILFGILAAKATNEGRYARYPFAIDFVR
jgi:uncharacterized Tic20 family protein